MARHEEEYVHKMSVEGMEEVNSAFGRHATVMGNAAQRQRDVLNTLAFFGPQVSGLGKAAIGAAKDWVTLAGKMEQSRIAFTTMLGSSDMAKSFIKDMQDFSAKTPFEFPELQDSVRLMMGMGFTADEILRKTGRGYEGLAVTIGNATAAMGRGPEMINYVTRALGQMKQKGRVSAEEINQQLAEQGIKAWEYLAEAYGKPISEVQKMAARGEISGELGVKIITEGMNKDFGGAMEAQANTLLGKLSTLRETAGYLKTDLGEALMPDVNNAVDGLKRLVEWFSKLSDAEKNAWAKGIAITGGLAVALGGVGALIAGLVQFNSIRAMAQNMKKVVDGTTQAKDLLTNATNRDITAEKKKTGVAKAEAAGFDDVADAVDNTTKKKSILEKATSRPAGYRKGAFEQAARADELIARKPPTGFTSAARRVAYEKTPFERLMGNAGAKMTGGLGMRGLMAANPGSLLSGGAGLGAGLTSGGLIAGTALAGWGIGTEIAQLLNIGGAGDLEKAKKEQKQLETLMGGKIGDAITPEMIAAARKRNGIPEKKQVQMQFAGSSNATANTTEITAAGDLLVRIPGDQVLTKQGMLDWALAG